MAVSLTVDELMEYTEWEREKWHAWFRNQGDQALKMSAGPNGDGRFQTVGDLMRHIFGAEKRYVDRLSNRPLTDAATISNDNIEALFEFGEQSRAGLRELVKSFPAQEWDAPQEYKILKYTIKATPRKIVIHVLMHEIRHWAQIATMFRLNGLPVEFHDFLMSPVLSGEFRIEQGKA
jgi:uncharacterized damage-inducible protein DinB